MKGNKLSRENAVRLFDLFFPKVGLLRDEERGCDWMAKEVHAGIKSLLSQKESEMSRPISDKKEVSEEEKKVFKEKWIPILESSAILLESSEISGTYNIDINHDDFDEMLKECEAMRRG